MAWTSNGFFRNVTILAQLDQLSGNQIVDFYQPGKRNVASIAPDVRYSGFVTSLRITIDVSSIAPVEFPTPDLGETEGELTARMRGMEAVAAKKQLNFWIRTEDETAIKIASLTMFNRRPYYTVDALVYFTDAAALDVSSDAVLSVQVENVGFGLLAGGDRVVVHGSAVEEAENTAPSLIVNVFGGGGTGGGTGGSVVTTDAGDPVTDNALNVVEV